MDIEQYKKVIELLSEGDNHSSIARDTGVSRRTISTMAEEIKAGTVQRRELKAGTIERRVEIRLTNKMYKCSECGVKTYLPCVACAARAYKKTNHSEHDECDPGDFTDLPEDIKQRRVDILIKGDVIDRMLSGDKSVRISRAKKDDNQFKVG
jgi:hypothetical protein